MRKEIGDLRDEDDGVIAYDEEDTIYKIKLRDMSLEQVIKAGISDYDRKKDAVNQNIRMPQILKRNIKMISAKCRENPHKTTTLILKKGNAEMEEMFKGEQLSWEKQVLTDTALCIPRMVEREALLNITSLEWDLRVLSGGKHTKIRMPWYVAGYKEEIETKMDMTSSDMIKLMLAAGISRSVHCRAADKEVLKETIKKVESIVLQQKIAIDGICLNLPEILENTFLDEEIDIATRIKRFDELNHVIGEATNYHQAEMERFITDDLARVLAELDEFFAKTL